MKITESQLNDLRRLKAYFPYRIVFGAISPSGEWEANAQPTKRRALSLARKGWQVTIYEAQP